MKTDLHIHSKDGSDGRWGLEEIFDEASKRNITLISITDHDSINCLKKARSLSEAHNIRFISGVELNVTFSHPDYRSGKAIALDFLGYNFDINNEPLNAKLEEVRQYRIKRAQKILENINIEFQKEGVPEFTQSDLDAIQLTVDGAFGRPHIASYMIQKGIVRDKQEAFDRYLVSCNVPKMALSLAEASKLIHGAGGRIVLAHPCDPNGTSLVALTKSLEEQQSIISDTMFDFIDGIECWHSRLSPQQSSSYVNFARENGLIITGGSDCHQQPVIMGDTVLPQDETEKFLQRIEEKKK